jgi:PAB1-binding protein PBP1
MGPADASRAPSSGNKSLPTAKKGTPNSNNNNHHNSVTSNIHRERLLHLSLTLIGQKVVVTLTDGTVLEGVFHTFTPFDGVEAGMKNKYVLTAVKVTKAVKETKIENGSTAILAVERVSSLYGKNINLDRPNQNGGAKTAKGEFATDSQISGTKSAGGKDLVAAGSAWTTGGKQTRAEALAGALGGAGAKDTSGLKGSIGKWDQFKANEELFNVNASFDENLYTTQLDKSQIDARKIAEAERIAREIENTTSTNIHIAEERGHAVETDYDEEDRYSGVLTTEGKQRHEAADKVKSLPKMNYAAAAAKADAAKKATTVVTESKPAQPTSEEAEKKDKLTAEVETKKEEKPVHSPVEPAPVPDAKPEAVKDTEDNKPEETKEVKKATKLNANAKEFTFNPSAKSFTPSFATSQPQMQPIDPAYHMHGGHPMQSPHYMPAQMGQPGTLSRPQELQS